MKISIDAISEQCKQDRQLFNVLFVLLSACNQNCIHCYIPEHDEIGMKLDDIKRVMREARELGALNVTLTGGEIFVRKDIFDIIAYAKHLHMRVFLMSNGSLLDEEKIKRLAEMGIAEFSTTLFSMNPDIHDYIANHKGAFEKTYRSIMLMKQYGIPVTVKAPLMETNKYDYIDVEKFASDNGFNFMSTTTIFPKCDGDNAPCSLRIKDGFAKVVKDLDVIRKKYRSDDIGYNKEGIPCGAGFNSITVNYDGTVWPCNSLLLSVGNVFESSLQDIWNNSECLNEWREKSVQPLEVCSGCKLKDTCLRCPGMALLEDGNLYGCSSSAKEIAEILRR